MTPPVSTSSANEVEELRRYITLLEDCIESAGVEPPRDAAEWKQPNLGTLPSDASARKQIPIATGFLDYFPLAVAEVARLSFRGNEQHNPGKALHWDRSKSRDEADALMRHFMERGTLDKDGQRHSAKVAWRAMALLQKELEGERGV